MRFQKLTVAILLLLLPALLLAAPTPPVTVSESFTAYTLDNGIVTARIAKNSGDLISLKYKNLEMLDARSARPAGYWSHNAARGLAGTPGTGCGNLYLEPGTMTPEEILAGVPVGFYVTALMGFGVNVVTGDYSRGATGLWIENGELTHAVEEVTIAGNLGGMLRNITAVGNDLVFRSSIASPTLRIDGMTVAGS